MNIGLTIMKRKSGGLCVSIDNEGTNSNGDGEEMEERMKLVETIKHLKNMSRDIDMIMRGL
jgi:hypothetical protein